VFRNAFCAFVFVLLAAVGCRSEPREESASVAAEIRAPLVAPALDSVPNDPLGASIRRGHALLVATKDSLPAQVGNNLRCVSCHLDDGRRADAMPWIGVYGRFPQYRPRAGRVLTLEDRINGCIQRSMHGTALERGSRDMLDMVSYMAFLSRGIPVGTQVQGQGTRQLRPLDFDTLRGERIYERKCAVCHGDGGLGTRIAPAVWGVGSYNIGAGMARVRTAAAFIQANMPFDDPGSLSDQEAFDVAAYINSRARPDFPAKENDWPKGDPPPDVAYVTKASSVRPPLTPPLLK
jgi:thiosulfate dehydrogenase